MSFWVLLNYGGGGGVMTFHKVYTNCQSLTTKPNRYHFQPKQSWINAPMYYKGYYHLFYQYNPKGVVWAHSVSKEMINWIPLEPSIVPSKPFDKYDQGSKKLETNWCNGHELETLRCENAHQSNMKLNKGDVVEVKGITASQPDVEVMFTFASLDKAETFDPEWSKLPSENLVMEICAIKGTTQPGGLGPFGLLTLASNKLEEYTSVFCRVFKTLNNKHKVLMCSHASP